MKLLLDCIFIEKTSNFVRQVLAMVSANIHKLNSFKCVHDTKIQLNVFCTSQYTFFTFKMSKYVVTLAKFHSPNSI